VAQRSEAELAQVQDLVQELDNFPQIKLYYSTQWNMAMQRFWTVVLNFMEIEDWAPLHSSAL
jgi:hypothetical protein